MVEVKSMTSYSQMEVRNRLKKAFRQIDKFINANEYSSIVVFTRRRVMASYDAYLIGVKP